MQFLPVERSVFYAVPSLMTASAMTTRKIKRTRTGETPKGSEPPTTSAVRHGAITRTLPSYSTYKRWSDQMKTDWQGLKDPQG